MNTRRLFREDVYLKTCEAVVQTVSTHEGKVLVTLDQTIFFPTGGGQSCDIGTMNGLPVVDVYEYKDDILHCVDCAPDALQSGDTVQLAIDWTHRFDNMQRHCGEHILSGMFYREYGGVNRGFHMGDNYMTVDISLEENPDFKTLTWEMAKHAELCTNEAIWTNAPVITRHFDTKAEAAQLPLRKALAIEKDITIVCVGAVETPSDCVACCGTHPSTAGQVGMVKIFKVEPNKGMFRVYFEAGRRAFLKYQEEMDVLTALCNKLSAGTEDVLNKYESAQEKNKESRTQLHLLKKEVLAREAAAIQAQITASAAAGDSLPLVRHYALLSLDDLASLGREISPQIDKIAFLVHDPTHTAFLVSNGKTDCGRLVKENASIYNGKGGGNASLARAIFTSSEYVDTFLDLIEKHLR